MNQRLCAITGTSGFVGQSLAKAFAHRGWKVLTLGRKGADICFYLGESPDPASLKNVDVLIHAAYDFSLRSWPDIRRVNAGGSEKLFDAAARAGVKRSIFISSMAAFEGCRSYYGRGKLLAEESLRSRGGIVVRPGFIYGGNNGGLAGKIANIAQRRVVPMIGSGHAPLYSCHIDDLCALVLHLAETHEVPRAPITAAHPKPITLKQIARASNGKSVIVPIPWRLVAGGLALTERFGLRLAFRRDNVVSLVHPNPQVDFTETSRQPVDFRAYRF